MAAGAAVPGFFFVFAAMVLLIFASVSSPTWNSISFLDTHVRGVDTRFGVFGYTGSQTHVGWYFPNGVADSTLNDGIMHNLTYVLVLIPVAAALSALSVLFGFCGLGYHRSGTVIMTLLSALATLVTLVAWVVDMSLFGIARHRVRDRGDYAQWGNANWLVLAALVSLFLGFFASLCGSFGSYRSRRPAY